MDDQSGDKNAAAELGRIVFVGVRDLLDQAMGA